MRRVCGPERRSTEFDRLARAHGSAIFERPLPPAHTRALCALAGLLSLAAIVPAQLPGFRAEPVAATPNQACVMAFAPDGRLFVGERLTGRILLLQEGRFRPWANISLEMSGEDQGILGVAVDPGYLQNGFVYVAVSGWHGDGRNHILRFRDVGGVGVQPTPIGPSTPSTNIHNLGPLVFGIDGMLYAHSGDALDPGPNLPPLSQSLENLHGKILRIQVPEGGVPSDNPFAGSYIWSFGHRNSFGLAVHPRSGWLYISENGHNKFDEVNLVTRAANYGWPQHEGYAEDPETVNPIWAWGPPTISPTGACVYSGELYPPQFRGDLFVGDYNNGRIVALDIDSSGLAINAETLFWTAPPSIYGVCNGPDGNLWVLRQGADQTFIERIVYDAGPRTTAAISSVSNVALGGSITLGFTGTKGDQVIPWLSARKYASPVPTMFGSLEVWVDLVLPTLTIGAGDRVVAGFAMPNVPILRDLEMHLQALSTGSTTRLTNAATMVLH